MYSFDDIINLFNTRFNTRFNPRFNRNNSSSDNTIQYNLNNTNSTSIRFIVWNVDSFIEMDYKQRLDSIYRYNDWDILVLVEAGITWTNKLMFDLGEEFSVKHFPKPYYVYGTEQGISIIWRNNLLKYKGDKYIIRNKKGENFSSGLVMFEDIHGSLLTVVGVHLKSWPTLSDDNYSWMRLNQINDISNMTKEWIDDNPRSELIIAGDFNHPINTPIDSFVESPPSIIKTHFDLRNIFHQTDIYHPDNTTMSNEEWLVDYTLISENLEVSELIPTTLDFYPIFNSSNLPSDHYPLSSMIHLKKIIINEEQKTENETETSYMDVCTQM